MIQPLQVIETISNEDLSSGHTDQRYPLETKISILPEGSDLEQEWVYLQAEEQIVTGVICTRDGLKVKNMAGSQVSQDIYCTQFQVEIDEYAFFLRKGEGTVLVAATGNVVDGTRLFVTANLPYLEDQAIVTIETIGNAIGTITAGNSEFIKINLWGKQVVPA